MTEIDIALTLDIDWAPDFMIDEIAEILVARRVRSTWFVTHVSQAVERLAARPDIFELGLHPNFLPGSSHGEDVDEVLRKCRSFVPSATAMRTHATVQSSPILDHAVRHGVAVDMSLFLPRQSFVAPFAYWSSGKQLVRIPYVWTDDYEMTVPQPVWNIEPFTRRPGLHVINFHPVHVWLNCASMEQYRGLKQRAPVLQNALQADCEDLRSDQPIGAKVMFLSVVNQLSKSGGVTASTLAARVK